MPYNAPAFPVSFSSPMVCPRPSSGRRRGFLVLTVGLIAVLGAVATVLAIFISSQSEGPPQASVADTSVATLSATQSPPVVAEPSPQPQPDAVATPLPPPLPPITAPMPATGPVHRTFVVARGQTMLGILAAAGLEAADAVSVVEALAEVANPDMLAVGQKLELEVNGNGEAFELRELSMALTPTRQIKVSREDDGGYSATSPASTTVVTHHPGYARLRIETSLYDAAVAAHIPGTVLAALVRAYSHDVDFQRDFHGGDSLELLYGRDVGEDGRPVRSAEPFYARLTLGKRDMILARFQPKGGKPEFFTAAGERVRKALLRTPLDGARVTSGYGMRRHPILGYSRMHRGVDFAAPKGTPVFAAGDGVVDMAGLNSGYGLYIRLRHDATWGTAYGHLSRLARGVRPGARVRQGQVLAYVGATGLATGPHLHYEVLKAGTQMNPAFATAMARPAALSGADRDAFLRQLHRFEVDAASLRAAGRLLVAEQPSTE